MTERFFVTIWLQAESSERDIEALTRTVRQVAGRLGILLEDKVKASPGGKRLTLYGTVPGKEDPSTELSQFESAVRSATNCEIKGRILK